MPETISRRKFIKNGCLGAAARRVDAYAAARLRGLRRSGTQSRSVMLAPKGPQHLRRGVDRGSSASPQGPHRSSALPLASACHLPGSTGGSRRRRASTGGCNGRVCVTAHRGQPLGASGK